MKVTNLRKKLRKQRIIKSIKSNSITVVLLGLLLLSCVATGTIITEMVDINNFACEENVDVAENQIVFPVLDANGKHTLFTAGAHSAITSEIVSITVEGIEAPVTQTPSAPEPEDTEESTNMMDNLASEYTCDKLGYVTATKLHVRELPTTNSESLKFLYWYQEVMYTESEVDGWYVIKLNDGYGYVSSDYISDSVPDEGKYFSVSGDNYKRKSFMDYRTIKSKSSRQYKLQYGLAYTGDYGIRMINDRYCIALGQYYTNVSGTYVDVYLANGQVLKCILSDSKQWAHTQGGLGLIGADGGAVEFVVDKPYLPEDARRMGSISYANREIFMSEVIGIRVYDKNILGY